MRIYFPAIFLFIIGTLLSVIVSRLFRQYAKRFWAKEISKIKIRYIVIIYAAFSAVWLTGRLFDNNILLMTGAGLMSLGILAGLVLTFVLPWALIYDYLSQKVRKTHHNSSNFDPGRRRFIKVATTSFPVFALGTVGTGMAGSFGEVRINEMPLYFPGLPENLDGLRILHLTDLHLGYYFHLSDLQETLREAESHQPDLVLVTGDVADDLSLLPGALDMISNFSSRHGSFMSLGNHEYMRGIEKVEKIVAQSAVPLLKNDKVFLDHNNNSVVIGGADDPKTLRGDIRAFLDDTISKTMADTHDADFRILMSHRPRALDVAPEYGVDLILSGHTHGGQIGFGGKSLFEGVIDKEPYMWGKYSKENAQLYTSAGLGHWLPFRLNCPPEAPMIILKQGVIS